MARHQAASTEASRDPERCPGPPDRHGARPRLLREVVAEERGAGRVITRFPDAQDRPTQEQLHVTPRQAGYQRGQAPDGHTDPDDGAAHPAVGPDPEGQRADSVDEEEGGGQRPDLHVLEVELILDL